MLSKRIANYTTKLVEEIEFSEETLYSHVGDRLVAVNGERLSYDSYGRLLNYKGKALTWQSNRLTSVDGVAITCDAFGRRVQKGDTTFTYDSSNNLLTAGALSFFYDTHGIAGFTYDGATYYYRKNIQGDVIALLDSTGAVVATYLYDAWGNCVVTTDTNGIGDINPIRYCSYYWDSEFGLYFLQSRYYSPELCRFISQDSIEYLDPESINGINLYAYCLNNPVMFSDPTGHMPEWAMWVIGIVAAVAVVALSVVTFGAAAAIGAAVGLLAGGLYGGLTTMASGGDFWTGFGIGAIGGAILGAGAGAASLLMAPLVGGVSTIATLSATGNILVGVAYAGATGMIAGSAMDILTQRIVEKNIGKLDWNRVIWSGVQYAIINIGNAFAGATLGKLNVANEFVAGLSYSLLFGVASMAVDVIREKYRR